MIVVTGAAGRLGRRVVQLLVDRGREVRVSDRLPADDLPAEFVCCELSDAAGVTDLISRIVQVGSPKTGNVA